MYKAFLGRLGNDCKANPKRFWSFFRSKTKCKNLPGVVEHSGVEATEPNDKANMFNEYFESVFVKEKAQSLPDIQPFIDFNLSNVPFHVSEVQSLLSKLDTSKACGNDNLSPRLLRECCAELAPSLSSLFALSLEMGTVPSQWKRANVIPVYKKGNKHKVTNYRPVSLLSIVSKVMERCVYNHVSPAVNPHIYTPASAWFLEG